MQGPLDADAFLQLAADDGLYSNVAALLTGPQDQLMRAAPDASFGWSPCTYTLATSEGSWPTSISTVVPCVDMYAVAQQCRTGYAHRPPAHRTRRRAARPEGGHRPWFATVRVPASGVPYVPRDVAPQTSVLGAITSVPCDARRQPWSASGHSAGTPTTSHWDGWGSSSRRMSGKRSEASLRSVRA